MKSMTYSQDEAASILGVAPRTVRKMVQDGRLARTQGGRLSIWTLADHLGTTPEELLALIGASQDGVAADA